MSPPFVSINIPCYNCEKYISFAIESILRQSYSNFEIIIVDDGSVDNSVNIIRKYRDPRIKLIQNAVNMGVATTRNIALHESQGDFIAILDSDDISYPTRIEEQLSFLLNNPEFAMVGSWLEVIDSNGMLTGEIRKTPEYSDILCVQMLFQNCFGQSTIMVRRSIIDNYVYSTDFRQAEDYDLWLRITNEFKASNIQKPLVKYRVHNKSISKKYKIMNEGIKQAIYTQFIKIGIEPDSSELSAHLVMMGVISAEDVSHVSSICWLNMLYKHILKLHTDKDDMLKQYFAEIVAINVKKYPLSDIISSLIKVGYADSKFFYSLLFMRIIKNFIKKTTSS